MEVVEFQLCGQASSFQWMPLSTWPPTVNIEEYMWADQFCTYVVNVLATIPLRYVEYALWGVITTNIQII